MPLPCANAPLVGVGRPTKGGHTSPPDYLCEVFPLAAGPRDVAHTTHASSGSGAGADASPAASVSPRTSHLGASIPGSPQMTASYGSHLHDLLFTHATHFTLKYVARSFYNVTAEHKKNKLFGHAVVLESAPAEHVSVVPPASGCGGGRGASVDDTARTYRRAKRYDHVRLRCPAYAPEEHRYAGDGSFLPGLPVSITSEVRGCRLAVNAGLFNVKSFACHGGLVSDGHVMRHSGGKENLPALGILASPPHANASTSGGGGGWGFVGYLTEAERAMLAPAATSGKATSASNTSQTLPPWSQLVSGLGWLVRDGGNYLRSGVPARYEDGAIQETTHELAPAAAMSSFIAIESARTGIGFDAAGRLVIGQLDGRSWWHGIDLPAFADWLVELGVQQAINVDGGASATMVRDGVVINNPSYACGAPGAIAEEAPVPRPGHVAAPAPALNGSTAPVNATSAAAGAVPASSSSSTLRRRAAGDAEPPQRANDDPNQKCKRPVSSVLCLHDSPPPPWVDADGRLVVHRGCVCLDLVATGSSTDEGGVSSTAFSWDALADLVRFVPVEEDEVSEGNAGQAGRIPLRRLMPTTPSSSSSSSSSSSHPPSHHLPCLCSPPSRDLDRHPRAAEALPLETYTLHVPVGPGSPRCLAAGPLQAAALSAAGGAGWPGNGGGSGSGTGGGSDGSSGGATPAGADTLLALSLLVVALGLYVRRQRASGAPLLPSASALAPLLAAVAGVVAAVAEAVAATARSWGGNGGYATAPGSAAPSPLRRGGRRGARVEDEDAGGEVEAADDDEEEEEEEAGGADAFALTVGEAPDKEEKDGKTRPTRSAGAAAALTAAATASGGKQRPREAAATSIASSSSSSSIGAARGSALAAASSVSAVAPSPLLPLHPPVTVIASAGGVKAATVTQAAGSDSDDDGDSLDL